LRTNNIKEKNEITVVIKFFADLRQYGPDKEEICLPEGSNVQNILEKYNIPLSKKNIIILINGMPHKEAKDTVQDGDVIAIFPPIAGG
jgi:molybdopterin converting factor small subunit